MPGTLDVVAQLYLEGCQVLLDVAVVVPSSFLSVLNQLISWGAEKYLLKERETNIKKQECKGFMWLAIFFIHIYRGFNLK